MYVPEKFALSGVAQAHDLIEDIRLGALIAPGVDPADPFHATHIPFMVDRDRGAKGVLIGHVARANPQWQVLEQAARVLVLFQGPSAYVSPSWYATAPRAPTWTYVSVQAQGSVRLVTDPKALRAMVLRLCNECEPITTRWRGADLPDSFFERLIPHIVGFEIEIECLDGAVRLGQNNAPDDRVRVARALALGDGQGRAVAQRMQEILEQEGLGAAF